MWWCAPHYQKGMPNSVARGRSQSNFLHHQRSPLHNTSSSIFHFFFFTNANLQDTPLSWVLPWRKDGETTHWWENFWPRWWIDETLLPTTENPESLYFCWPSFLGSNQKLKSQNLWTLCLQSNRDRKDKQTGLNWTHKEPTEDLGCAWTKGTNDPGHRVLWLILQLKFKAEASISSNHHRFKKAKYIQFCSNPYHSTPRIFRDKIPVNGSFWYLNLKLSTIFYFSAWLDPFF